MRAAICVRVSPRPAENVRYSPAIQESECRSWCEANGHEVVTVISDILVSGGSRSRFDSILRALDEYRPELFVVADLSRWTRDTPTRYYAMRAIVEDAGARLVSVSEPIVGSDQPFSDTITTALVEGNFQQRIIANRKTSVGVRKAWAAGKRWSRCFGWTWHPLERHDHGGDDCPLRGEWSQDVDTIRNLYVDWIGGVTLTEMAERYGIHRQAVRRHIMAVRQKDIVPDLWDRAQAVTRGPQQRDDAKWGSVYRGLLICPFCGWTLTQSGRRWGNYKCNQRGPDHGWTSISTQRWVTPTVRTLVSRVRMPPEMTQMAKEPRKPRSGVIPLQARLDRLSEAWIAGRLSTERYEMMAAKLEVEKQQPHIEVPVPEQVRMVESMAAMAPYLDCPYPCQHDRCPRERMVGNAVNAVLRQLLERIEVHPDRTITVVPREDYLRWYLPE